MSLLAPFRAMAAALLGLGRSRTPTAPGWDPGIVGGDKTHEPPSPRRRSPSRKGIGTRALQRPGKDKARRRRRRKLATASQRRNRR